jgi:hypothetical protein
MWPTQQEVKPIKLFNTVWQITSFFSNLSGQILIKNWKPLPLEKISDNPLVSVSDILGELTSVVTLKITILRSKPTQLAEIKDKLLKLLILQSHAVLRSTGCPLDEVGQVNIISINFFQYIHTICVLKISQFFGIMTALKYKKLFFCLSLFI